MSVTPISSHPDFNKAQIGLSHEFEVYFESFFSDFLIYYSRWDTHVVDTDDEYSAISEFLEEYSMDDIRKNPDLQKQIIALHDKALRTLMDLTLHYNFMLAQDHWPRIKRHMRNRIMETHKFDLNQLGSRDDIYNDVHKAIELTFQKLRSLRELFNTQTMFDRAENVKQSRQLIKDECGQYHEIEQKDMNFLMERFFLEQKHWHLNAYEMFNKFDAEEIEDIKSAPYHVNNRIAQVRSGYIDISLPGKKLSEQDEKVSNSKDKKRQARIRQHEQSYKKDMAVFASERPKRKKGSNVVKINGFRHS